MMSNKSKIILIAGFLGAGKTTLLRHIISGKRDMSGLVLVINEFGKIGIDATLIKKEEADIIELTSGCICCTLAIDLKILLKKIFFQYNPHTIFVEASGVADPRSIISVFKEKEIAAHILAQRTVTVLDAGFWEMRSIMGDIFHSQLDPADLILFNKVDLLETDKIKQYLYQVKQELPHTRVIPTVYGRIDLESVLWGHLKQQSKSSVDDHFLEHKAHSAAEGFATFSFQDSSPLNEVCFKRFVSDMPLNIFRLKGTVRFQDRTVMINHVGGKSEWTDEDKVDETRLIFIGWDIECDETLARLKECLMGES